MAENHGGGVVFLSFVVGAMVGAVVGVLFAPKAGKETREEIGDAASDLKKEAQKFSKEAMARVEGFVEDSKAALAKATAREAKEKA